MLKDNKSIPNYCPICNIFVRIHIKKERCVGNFALSSLKNRSILVNKLRNRLTQILYLFHIAAFYSVHDAMTDVFVQDIFARAG